MRFLLTRPSRGATAEKEKAHAAEKISTHTPLAGRDGTYARDYASMLDISTHTPLAGRDSNTAPEISRLLYFYSHAPRGARHP